MGYIQELKELVGHRSLIMSGDYLELCRRIKSYLGAHHHE